MNIKINKDLCIGCGSCVSVCAEVFELDSEGKSVVKKGANLVKNSNCVKEAEEICPVQAIEVM